MPEPTPAPAPDLLDRSAGLEPDASVFALRRQREKVRLGAEASLDALLDAALPGSLTRADRLAIGLHAAATQGSPVLADHYRALLALEDPALLALIDADLAGEAPAFTPRLAALLAYARTLLERPIDGDAAALQALGREGLAVADIVALSQLVGFLSFQIRVGAGVAALASLAAAR
jgi:CMD domain protein